MSVSIVTVANLGEKQNLKTTESLPVIDTFAQKKELKQVICQINKNFYFPDTSSAIPKYLRYFIRACEKLTGLSLGKGHQQLFDLCASIRLKKCDVVMLHPGPLMRLTALKAKRMGAKVVNIASITDPRTNIDIEEEEAARYGARNSGKVKREFEKYKRFYDFDYIVAYSDIVKQSYVENGFPADRVFTAHNDVPVPIELTRGEQDIFRVLYVAYTSPRKGLQYLLEAWQELKLSKSELVLVGEYNHMPDEIRKYCDDIIASDLSIKWMGGTNDVGKYYREASVFVLPSLSEGNPRVVMEAMSQALPVIVTPPAQGIVEDGKDGFVIPVRDATAIREKIEYLYRHRDITLNMGREARKAMQSKKSFGESVFEIYQEILKREGKSS
jgi:glycosyltransferase involved in cell wall biosynthesis